jgi:FixJ family two-component response regulator
MLRASGYEVSVHDSGREFLDHFDCETSGCVVTDLAMPEIDGLALQEALQRSGCELPIIFLSGQGTIPDSVAAMRHGAVDFLTKQAPREDLLKAIDQALDANRRRQREREGQREDRHKLEQLSKREREVLRLVVKGWLNKQIASELGIHERTVKLHRTSIYGKTGIVSAAELTSLCLRTCFFEDPPGTFPKGQ